MELDYTRLLETINIDLLITLIITTILSLATEGAFEIFKHGYRKILKGRMSGNVDERLDVLEQDRAFYMKKAAACEGDQELSDFYRGMAHDTLTQIRELMQKRTPISWIHVVAPVAISLVFVVFLRPFTIFYLLPFQPESYAVSVAITAILCSRVASGAHDGLGKLHQFFDSIINRVSSRF